jgi:hypothetical protein
MSAASMSVQPTSAPSMRALWMTGLHAPTGLRG